MKNNSSHIILGRIVIFLIVCSIAGLEMVAAAGGERGHIKNQSFTFQPGDIQPNEVPRGFEELWPHNESYHSTATPDCRGQEIDCSLEALLKDNVAMFRETLELPHRNHATTLHELLRHTLEDLKCTYPKCTSCIQISDDSRASTAQVLLSLYKVLKYVGDIWAGYQSENYRADKDKDIETLSSQQIGERVLDGLSYMSSRAKEMFDLLDKDSINNTHQRIDHSNLFSPLTPTSVLPEVLEYQSNSKEFQNLVHISPLLRPLRLQAVGKLKPMDIKRLSFHMLPPMVDQESHRMNQTDNINGDLELDFTEASMSVETNLNAIIGNIGGNNPESRTSEATALTSASTQPHDHPLQLRKSVSSKAMLDVPSSPHIHQAMSVEQKVDDPSKCGGWNGKMSKSSEATILLASQPIMHVQTPHIHQAISVEQKVDDSSKCGDCNGKKSKSAEAATLLASQPIMHVQTPHIHQAMSVGQKVEDSSKCDDCNGKKSKPAEATILLASQPIMQVQTPHIHQAMSVRHMIDDSSKCADCNGKMSKPAEATILASQPIMHLRTPHIHQATSVGQKVYNSSKCDDRNEKMSTSSEATVLLAPQSIMHVQAPQIHQAMSKEQMVDDSSKCGDCSRKIIKSSEAAIPLAPQTTMQVHAPHIHHVMSVEKMVDDSRKCGDCNGKMSKSSEATVLLAPQPMMHIQTTKIPSAPPTPPSSPMVLTGMYMPFFDPTMNMESIAFAMSADDIEAMDTDNSSKPSNPAISVKAPPTTTSQSRETRQEPLPPPLPPPPPAASVQQKEIPVMQEQCTVKLPLPPPPPPPPPTRSVPMPPPPPHSKCLTTSPSPPPLPPLAPGSAPLPPVSSGAAGSAPPPPPPAMKSLRAKKNTKLKRSSQMGNMYRVLKGKVEGSSLNGKKSQGKKGIGGKSSGNSAQGMADALAEITKRSSYFQQIEEDVKNHSTVILELKSSVSSFRAKDISELTKFHKQVEIHLEKLSDESQVLARFEGFPTKKLETIRMAVALYSKLEEIAKTLKSWKVVSPVAQQLDKVESYFNKIKEDVDATDRNKDEESKRFKSHNIEIDFNVLVRIKESMVDLSSNCIETALKEAKEAKSASKEANSKGGSHCKMLWTAFQLSFRVYNFAGGQDERADRLTNELAHEIEMCQF